MRGPDSARMVVPPPRRRPTPVSYPVHEEGPSFTILFTARREGTDTLASVARGSLRVYLGAAPGVGKTFAMLNEGCRRQERGTDVVIGYVETHGRPATAAQLGGLEVVPRRLSSHRGQIQEEMDVDAVLRRRPAVALVDELAHTNAVGSARPKRWQDVKVLLDAGITVVSTLNIQHIESLNDVVAAITGVQQHETVPDAFVRAAEQVELIDMTPEALRRRMAHGHVYPAERVDIALANYFRYGNLVALRELALLWVADSVEEQLQGYRERHGIEGPWETRERVLVALTGAPSGEHLIRRAARMARRAQGELVAVHVVSDDGLRTRPASHLDEQRALVADLGGSYREVVASDVAEAILLAARAENATQVVLGGSHRSRWARLSGGSVVNAVIAESGETLDVHVISPPASTPEQPEGRRTTPERRHGPRLQASGRVASMSRQRRWSGLVIAAVTLPLITVVLASTRGDLALGTISLIYLLPVVAAAAVGGVAPGLLAGVAGFLLLNWYFSPPIHTFTIADPRDIVALAVFLVVAAVISAFVDLAARRANEARRTRAQAAALARAASALLDEPDPVPALVEEIYRTFLVTGVAVLRASDAGWEREVLAGPHPPSSPEDATVSLPIDAERALALRSPRLRSEDAETLRIFVNQIAVAVANRQLRVRAGEAAAHAKANEVRTALLAAVSHDLRTPLASIKAAATSLLSDDVVWEPAAVRDLLETIDAEVDRLTELVANLLDMSRIRSGGLVVRLGPVGLDEVVSAALRSIPRADRRVELDVPETVPAVSADPPLLERAVANLLDNALAVSEEGRPVRILAGRQPDGWIELRIADRGPGIPPWERERVFLPFQRLGDQGGGAGVGLGLAVAKGFVEAMGGELLLEDTPGGGVTMAVRLRESERTAGAAATRRLAGDLPAVQARWDV